MKIVDLANAHAYHMRSHVLYSAGAMTVVNILSRNASVPVLDSYDDKEND